MTKLVLEHVSLRMHQKDILRDISFACNEHTPVTIVGPSGAGKTSLLKTIAGLYTGEGRILLDDTEIGKRKPDQRSAAMIFQSAALYPHTKIRDNIAVGLKARGMSRQEIQKAVHDTAELMHIEDLLDRYPATLSGGEQQRADIARALVRNPRVLLMDEPFSSLDPDLSEELRREIETIAGERHIIRIEVTHDPMDAMAAQGTVIYLADGRIREAGRAKDLYQDPMYLDTAEFFGVPRMNTWSVRVNHGCMNLLDREIQTVLPDGSYTLGIYPQEIHEGTQYTGRIEHVSVFGDRYLVRLMCSGVPAVLLMRTVPDKDSVSFDLDEDRLRVFSSGGVRLKHGI